MRGKGELCEVGGIGREGDVEGDVVRRESTGGRGE